MHCHKLMDPVLGRNDMSVKQGFAGLLVVLSLALAGPQQAWASPGGGHGEGGGGEACGWA